MNLRNANISFIQNKPFYDLLDTEQGEILTEANNLFHLVLTSQTLTPKEKKTFLSDLNNIIQTIKFNVDKNKEYMIL